MKKEPRVVLPQGPRVSVHTRQQALCNAAGQAGQRLGSSQRVGPCGRSRDADEAEDVVAMTTGFEGQRCRYAVFQGVAVEFLE